MAPVKIERGVQTTPEQVARHTRLGDPVPRANDGLAGIETGTVLADKVRAVYETNPRARVYINRLLDGYPMGEVLAELASEIRFNDSRIRIIEDQNKKAHGRLARQSHYGHVLSKRPRLAETRATLELLRTVANWQRWFANRGADRRRGRHLDVG